MADPKWKRFEKRIHEIHQQLAPEGATITYDDKIMGSDSGTERQVEITIRYRLAGYDMLLIIDCKDYAEPVDVVDMGSFKSLAQDVRANKAVMITTNGFTPAAVQIARSTGIETRTYLETDNSEWRSEVSIPMLISGIKIEAWKVTFSAVPGQLSESLNSLCRFLFRLSKPSRQTAAPWGRSWCCSERNGIRMNASMFPVST